MEIKKIDILYANKGNEKLFEQFKDYDIGFHTLITSKGDNSKGKTTLIRFILFALGFSVPLTDGILNHDYKTKISFIHNDNFYLVEREKEVITVRRNDILIDNKKNNYLLNLFSISSFEDLDNLLGCFYIDQEKGWTLLNRGRIIGKRTFNIERFISFINNLPDIKEKITENKNIDIENKKIKIFKDMAEIKKELLPKEEEYNKNEINSILELEKEIELINSKINSLIYHQKSLKDSMDNKNKFIERLSLYELKIKINGNLYPINSKNITGFKVENKFIELEIRDIENEITILKKQKSNYEKKLQNIRNATEILALNEIFSRTYISKENLENLEIKKLSNSKLKKNNNKYIKENLDKSINDIWEIMEPILTELNVLKEYVTKDIIFKNKLSGISGTQLHKLTFSLKLSLLVYIKKKLKIELPFIIDSPMSGEVNEKTANIMISLAEKKLRGNQIIISSVYDNYELNFDKIITLDDTGVLGNLKSFLLK